MFRKILAFSLTLVLTACGIQPTPHLTPTPFTGTVRPVIIDTDMAADDWMAILYLLNRPDVSVAAITVSGTGEAHCEPGIKKCHESALLWPDNQIFLSVAGVPLPCKEIMPFHRIGAPGWMP